MKIKFVVFFVVLALLVLGEGFCFMNFPGELGRVSASSCSEEFCECFSHCSVENVIGGTVMICPAGDGQRLEDLGLTVGVWIRNRSEQPLANIPANCIRLRGEDPWSGQFMPCDNGAYWVADQATDEMGHTTISGTFDATVSGNGDFLYVTFGEDEMPIKDPWRGCTPLTYLPIKVKCPDLDQDKDVDLSDFSIFGQAYPSTPASDTRCDFDGDNDVDLADYSMFIQHWQHGCD